MIETVQNLFETAANATASAATSSLSADTTTAVTGLHSGLVAIGSGIAAIGVIGTGLGQGFAAGKAVEAVGRNPEAESKIRIMFIIAAGIAETSAIYAFVIALLVKFLG